MRARYVALATLLLSLAAISACAVGPDWDRQVGGNTSKQVRDEMGILEDSGLQSFVSSVGRRLTDHLADSQFRYTFTLVDDRIPNAFAAPGGYVFVTRGLLAGTNSEDELAGVMAHEIIHVRERHSAARYQRAKVPGVLALPGRITGLVLPRVGDAVSSPFEGIGAIALASYGRDQEREADQLGLDLAARAGYDPQGLNRFLETMNRYETLIGTARKEQDLLSSHPLTPERLRYTREMADGIERKARPGVAADRAAYLRLLDGMVLGPNPAEGVFDENRFLHPDSGVGVTFPAGWKYANARKFVGATSPRGDAAILYDPPIAGSDPRRPAEELIAELKKRA